MKHLNLSAAQARHLHDTGSLLVVESVKPQPEQTDPHPVCVNGIWRWKWSHGLPMDDIGPAPLGKPGDVVLCREPCRYSVEHDNYYYEADSKGVGTLVYVKLSGKRGKSISARDMPEESIRLRSVIKSVECRKITSMNDDEACQTGIVDGTYLWASGAAKCDSHGNLVVNQFQSDWDRRHRRRGPEFGFERAWGFFYRLSLQQAGEVRPRIG